MVKKYYIISDLGYLSNNNSVDFEYWTNYSNKDAQRKMYVFAWLKLQFIKIIWKIQGTKYKLWLSKAEKIERDK